MTSKEPLDNATIHDLQEDSPSNTSGNRPFTDVAGVYASRRKVLKGGLTFAAASFFAAPMAFAAKGGKPGPNGAVGQFKQNGLISFDPVLIADGSGPVPAISADYDYQVLIPWGTAIEPGTSDYTGNPVTRPTAAEQAKQIGIGHDGMWFFPDNGSNERGVLCINHEFGRNTHLNLASDLDAVDRGSSSPSLIPNSLEAVLRSQNAHGVGVVEIYNNSGTWELDVASNKNRRIHVNTPVAFSGPVAADHPLLNTGAQPRGTVNNCANGYTPWGTYLTCEENFNGYFGDESAVLDLGGESPAWIGSWSPTEEQERYGFSSRGFDYGWERFDPRFDLSQASSLQETNRFGWVVEIDPMAPNSAPVKRTALGRFKHEGVALTVGQGGRAVAYMGDDQRFDYIYKFVSDDNWQAMRAQGKSPLDHGKLYAARFNDDGSGDWLELTIANPALDARFSSQEEVLVYARIAADIVGATPMNRPEWTTVAPNGDVYCALTNNSRRQPEQEDSANPLQANSDGHIIRWHDSEQHTGTTFDWEIFIISDDTQEDGDERTFGDPDGLWVDPDGRLFIQTDGGQKKGLNNQMLVCSTFDGPNDPTDPGKLDVRRLFTGVSSDEITGITVTPDRRIMFINTQHPGNGDPTRTNFPAATDGVTIPRDCTIVITRKDGGIIGS